MNNNDKKTTTPSRKTSETLDVWVDENGNKYFVNPETGEEFRLSSRKASTSARQHGLVP